METTIVVFRKFRNDEVIALFPHPAGGACISYQHIGQHGEANYATCIAITEPTVPHEYAELKAELENIGYVLEVRQRRPT